MHPVGVELFHADWQKHKQTNGQIDRKDEFLAILRTCLKLRLYQSRYCCW